MIPNEWIRIVSGALLVILMAKVLGTTDYLGAGMDVVERAVMDGKVAASAFLLKIIFTAVTLGCGFRGGEIVPTLFVGATFGCLFGQITACLRRWQQPAEWQQFSVVSQIVRSHPCF